MKIKPVTLLIAILFIILTLQAFAQSKYNLPCTVSLLIESRDSLLSQVGVREKTGKNDGEVEKYLHSVGLRRGSPYCAAGLYWCFKTAQDGIKLHCPNYGSEIPIKRTGLANGIFNDAKKRGVKVKFKPVIDDLLVWRKKNSWKGHIERIIAVGRGGWVTTVGFNTGNGKSGSQREGNGVFKRRRNINMPLGRMLIRGLVGFNQG